MKILQVFSLISTLLATSQVPDLHIPNQIHLHRPDLHIYNQIHFLRPLSGSRGHDIPGVSCSSWRLAVETNNIIGWTTVPEECVNYVGHYMLGQHYRNDSKVVTGAALDHAKSMNLTGDGKDIWVFDVDETTLSNLPYYATNGFGSTPYNSTLFNAWVLEGKAPALPESLKLYKSLLSLGIKVVFLTGRTEDQRNVTVANLKEVGYHTWEKLILKQAYIYIHVLKPVLIS